MNEKTKFRANRVLLILAIFSFVVASIEGVLFYWNNESTPVFFRILQIIQNSIKAFAFKPVISLGDAVNLMNSHSSFIYTVSCYAYGVAVFTAPYCTLTVLYKVMQQFLFWILKWRSKSKKEQILIFGYNDDVKSILDQENVNKKDYGIRIVSEQTLSLEEKYSLSKRGFQYHEVNMIKVRHEELPYLLEKFNIRKSKYILLFEDSSIKNYSLLQIFPLTKGQCEFEICPDTKIICRCEDDGVAEMISEYYNPPEDKSSASDKKKPDRCYDLELCSIPALQVSRMFENVPLHNCYIKSDKKLSDWKTHLLIAGFGAVGQQVVLQTMNLAVVSPDNPVVIDVYDQDIDKKAAIFAARFSDKTFDITENSIIMRPGAADGHFEIRFFKTDVRSFRFIKLVRQKHEESQYTYATVTIDQIDISTECANKLGKIFDETGNTDIPIVIRMDSDRRLADYIQQARDQNISVKNGQTDNTSVTFPRRFRLLTERSEAVTLKNILNEDLNKNARIMHDNYSGLKFANDSSESISWNSLSVLKRESNKALSAYDPMWNDLLRRRLSEEKTFSDTSEFLMDFFENKKTLWLDKNTWYYNSDYDLIRQLNQNRVMLFLTKTEHRRWSYFLASKGWHNGDDAQFKGHPCLLTYEMLEQDTSINTTIKYDLLPFMKRYTDICYKKITE